MGASPDNTHAGEAEHFLSLACRNPFNRIILERLPALELPDCMLAGGSLFQAVWNIHCGNAPDAHILDYDLFYYDAADTGWQAEDAVIRKVNDAFQDLGITLQARNQARVHLWYQQKFGIPCAPLADTADGIDHFLSTSACFGVRPGAGAAGVYAPYGFGDLHALVVRPNRRRHAPEAYAAKCARWKSAWPRLTILPWHGEPMPTTLQENQT